MSDSRRVWCLFLVLAFSYHKVFGACGSFGNCKLCVKTVSCVWCDLANATQLCVDGTLIGPTDGTVCKNFDWGQCLISGSFLGSKYSYAVVIGVGSFVLVFGVAVCSVCCYKKCKKRKGIGLPGDIEMVENPKKRSKQTFGIPSSIADVNRECEVCFDLVKDTLLAPCGHICMCYDCAVVVKTQKKICPICRTPILSIYRAYFI